MRFSEAYYRMMNERVKIKLPHWDGYWEWDNFLKSTMNCMNGNRTRVSSGTIDVMIDTPCDKWMIVDEEDKDMKNTYKYKTNYLSCEAVQLKDINDIESFNKEVNKVFGINIDDQVVSSTPNPILFFDSEDLELEKALCMTQGDYLVKLPAFKNPIVMYGEMFEKMFEKVEDK